MNLPEPGEYIDIHTHDSTPAAGIFAVENLMVGDDLCVSLRLALAYFRFLLLNMK